MKCIIIDDEPLAQELLEDFISKIPFLELVASCSNGFEATTALQTQKIDLIFSDIEMPHFSGIDFIKSLDNKPMFIFTTAYSHYAVEGFNLNAIDYLVKPIPFHRFLKAATRAQNLLKLKVEETSAPPTGLLYQCPMYPRSLLKLITTFVSLCPVPSLCSYSM